MLVNKLQLNDFRNYKQYSLEFNPSLNIIIGPNGVGKTNILEAIIMVSNCKSFRTMNDEDLIQKNKEYARIILNSPLTQYKVVINKEGKSLYINNQPIKKTSEFIGKINAVVFKPHDLELFSGSPAERRKLLDVELSKISSTYMDSLLRFKKLLVDKNNILKQLEIDETLMSIINESLVEPIKNIVKERSAFFEEINKYLSEIYQKLSNSDDSIEVIYKKCSELTDIKENIEKSKDKDNYYHYTTFGPHHDDYYFKFNEYELNSIASQGQKRMVLIAFKFALIKYIENYTKQKPIVLLDDILSELDQDNQLRLINLIPEDIQTIITNTDIQNLKINREYHLIELKENSNV